MLGRVFRKIKRVLKKAAPRFELGIKDLQSSALPLGHAATVNNQFPLADRISQPPNSLLVLSNGHGEDLIALQLLEAFHKARPTVSLQVMPLVGEGRTFGPAIRKGWLQQVGPAQRLPSGGFSNQSFRGLARDVVAGLLQLSWRQWRFVRQISDKRLLIVAVGDLLPLFLAWSSGVSYVFLGTPKSDYTWKSSNAHALSDFYHCLKGTEWDPWEYSLMRSQRCKLVAVRDQLTARGLRKKAVRALAPGNPMMDAMQSVPIPSCLNAFRRLMLLCGSRNPEALINFQRLISSVDLIEDERPLAVLVALGSEPTVEQIAFLIESVGFSRDSFHNPAISANGCWVKGNCRVFIGSGQFSRWAGWAEVGLATAGTATEQLVGLGIPVLSLPGKGPQFKSNFAIRQSRLLGGAVMPYKTPKLLAQRLQVLLDNNQLRQKLGNIGMQRMGPAGGSAALSSLISDLFAGIS